MTECDEVAANMSPPVFNSLSEAERWVKTQMQDESMTIRDNIAQSLYEKQTGKSIWDFR